MKQGGIKGVSDNQFRFGYTPPPPWASHLRENGDGFAKVSRKRHRYQQFTPSHTSRLLNGTLDIARCSDVV